MGRLFVRLRRTQTAVSQEGDPRLGGALALYASGGIGNDGIVTLAFRL
jgi:hypothetical protein